MVKGLACDQLVASEIATADGKVWPLSDTDNRELFWACRGGGGDNFGIKTSCGLQKAICGANLARLACVKGGVDPDYVFRFAQSIPPARCP